MIGDQFARLMQQQISAAPRLHNLQALFAADDKAVLLDFAGISNLYSTPAGTASATVGSPAGMHLDLSRGLELEPEIAPQGGLFPSATGWTTGAGTVVAGGVATTTAVAPGTTTVNCGNIGALGGLYKVIITIDSISGNLQPVLFGNVLATLISSPGTYTYYAAASAINCFIQAITTTTTAVCSKFSVQRIKGTPAFQGTTPNCPILRRTSVTGRYWLEADSDDALNLVFPSAPGTMYVGRATAEGFEWTTETWGTTVNTLRQGRYNAGVVARSRDWTAPEKALIEAYFARQLPMLSANLLANPGFADSSAWTPGGAEWTIGAGVAAKAASAGTLAITQSVGTIAELAVYGYDLVTRTAGNFSFSGAPSATVSTPGIAYRWVGAATAAAVGPRADAAGAGTVDNVSYRRIL